MSRNVMLAVGSMCWAVAAIDAIFRVVTGDWIALAIMVVAGIAGVALVTRRRARRNLPEGA